MNFDIYGKAGRNMEQYGTIRIHLDELIRKAGISKNKLSHRAEMQRTQINHYCNNEISRLDIDVLARLCTVLDCKIGDLLEFVPVQQVGEE
jgi:putative transcriptional regulator